MKPPIFAYERPQSVQQCLSTLARQQGEVRLLAGGQSLMPMLNFRLAKPDVLIDINGLTELCFIEASGEVVRIGALTRHRELLEDPLVREFAPLITEAAHYIGHPAVRNRGTFGGSVSHADPAAELPVALTALQTEIVLKSQNTARALKPGDFFAGPLITNRRPDELLTEVIIRRQKGGWSFKEVSRRHGDFALVSVAATVELDGKGAIANVALALGGITDRPIRAAACESALKGKVVTPGVVRQACARVADGLEVNADIHATAQYRRHLAEVLAAAALEEATARARRATRA